VKDYNDLCGAVTTYGSPIFSDNVAQGSDATVRQLETNGAIWVTGIFTDAVLFSYGLT
jgi:amidase